MTTGEGEKTCHTQSNNFLSLAAFSALLLHFLRAPVISVFRGNRCTGTNVQTQDR